MKRLLTAFCVLGLGIVSAVASASEISIYIDGVRDDGRFPPLLRNGRTMMFLRDTFNRLGAAVQWFPTEKRIKCWQADTEIELWIDRKVAVVNGREVELDQAPIIENYEGMGGATLVPLRFVAEALGAPVTYDGKQNRVDIALKELWIMKEKAPFKAGDTVEILMYTKDMWIPAKVIRVFDYPDKIDSYVVEYKEEGPNGRVMTPNVTRTYVRKPRG